MSLQLINRSADLKRLVDEGYAIRIEAGHLIVEDIPYLDEDGVIRRGVFVCLLNATSEMALPPQGDHVMSFVGEFPHDRHGRPLEALGKTSPRCGNLPGLTAKYGFSNKPRGPNGLRDYVDYYEKVTTYEHIILGEVHAIDPTATARVGALELVDEPNVPFYFPDSASARAGTTALAAKLDNEVVAIIGLGGTGSHVFDHVAKNPVLETRVFDGDRFFPHNAFRAPGAPTREELQPPRYKVDYHGERYGRMKKNITRYAEPLTSDNLERLEGVTFAFLCMDPSPAKAAILKHLEAWMIPFVDVGMGLHIGSKGLGGTLRAVLSTAENRDSVRQHIPMTGGGPDDPYTANIQVSELNSLNATMAVMLWKTYREFYADFSEPVWLFQVETRQFIREAA